MHKDLPSFCTKQLCIHPPIICANPGTFQVVHETCTVQQRSYKRLRLCRLLHELKFELNPRFHLHDRRLEITIICIKTSATNTTTPPPTHRMPTPTWELHCTHCGDTWAHEKMPGTAQMLWFNAKKALRSQIPQPQDPLICETCLLLLREAPNCNFSGNPFLEKEGEAFKHSPVRPRPSLSRSLSFSGHSNENLSVGVGEDRESSNGKIGATPKHPIEMSGRVPDSRSSEEALVAPQSRRVSIIAWMVGLADSAATSSSGGGGAANSQTLAAGPSALQTPDVEDSLQDIRIPSPTLNLSSQNLGEVIQSTSSQGNALDPPRPASQGGQKDMQEARSFFLDSSGKSVV